MKSTIIMGFTLLITNISFASTPDLNMIHTAKAVKAILEKGHALPAILDVQEVEQMSIPPKNCIMIIYERKPNTTCPDEDGQGPYLDKGFAACFNLYTDEVDSVIGMESQCLPKN